MPFAGHELFPIKQGGQLIKKPLSAFDDWEVIFVANMLRNDDCDEGADMLLNYLQRRRAATPDLGVSKLALRRWLNLWVNRTPYLRALATDGAVRYALDGSPGDPVSLDHQEHALAELKRRLALKAKSRKRKPSVADTPRPAPTPEPSPVVAPVITAATLGRPLITLKRKAAA